MVDYQVGPGRREVIGDRDLRHRLLARIGAPLTASGMPQELSAGESVAPDPFAALVSSVYAAVQ